MLLGSYTHEEFMEVARLFHGYPAPGIIIGAYMVEYSKQLLQNNYPEIKLYNAISESAQCLPDAIQLLTPCTIGNGWLKIVPSGRYAMSLFDKYTGEGVRVWLDVDKMGNYPTIKEWFMKTKPKREQDSDLLQEEIYEAKLSILSSIKIRALLEYTGKHDKGNIIRCALCEEAIPARYGIICPACQGYSPYRSEEMAEINLRAIPVEDALGRVALHDMTRIEPGKFKGVQVKAGQVLEVGDLCDLQRIGKNNIYVLEDSKDINSKTVNGGIANTEIANPTGFNAEVSNAVTPSSNSFEHAKFFLHENDCAIKLSSLLGGQNVEAKEHIREGKVSFLAQDDGLLWLDEDRINSVNELNSVVVVTRRQGSRVKSGDDIAASRAIPLYLSRTQWLRVENLLQAGPLFSILPIRKLKVGILVTGTEVFQGIIEDKFAPIISQKVEAYACSVVDTLFVPDDANMIEDAIINLRIKGAELIVSTAGLSVDPDDVTRKGLLQAGLKDTIYGVPILPGSMSLVGKFDAKDALLNCDVIGVPACALFFKITAFDMLLPMLLAQAPLDIKMLAKRGNGGLCEECSVCTYPHCPFAT